MMLRSVLLLVGSAAVGTFAVEQGSLVDRQAACPTPTGTVKDCTYFVCSVSGEINYGGEGM